MGSKSRADTVCRRAAGLPGVEYRLPLYAVRPNDKSRRTGTVRRGDFRESLMMDYRTVPP